MTEKSLSYRNCDKMIVVEHLSAGYGRKVILSDISLILPSSSLVAVIGRNGTGKSTLIRTLAGLLPPLSGKTSIGGKDIYRMTAVERARLCAFVGTEKIRVP
ncbi:MAG: ATP-binding cassette domain-containing protein, partial [Bacteroidetes bacterium]|nr:ATP-binding cassette domain-containing protein [Candidatus Cryptobacteroides excrementavium]